MNITDKIAEIEARANSATEGPWDTESDWPRVMGRGCNQIVQVPGRLTEKNRGEATQDTIFIAAARTDVPALCQEVRRLLAICERARAEVILGHRAVDVLKEAHDPEKSALR